MPIRCVTIVSPDGHERELADCPYLSRVRVLRIGNCHSLWARDVVTDDVIRHLARSTRLTRIDALGVGPVRATRGSLRELAAASFLERLGKDGLFVRIVVGAESDYAIDFVDIKAFHGPASRAIEEFLAEYGDQLPAE